VKLLRNGARQENKKTVHTEEEVSNIPAETYNEIYAYLYSGEVLGKQRITEHWKKYSPYYLAKTLPKETLHKVRWYIDCGDDVFLYIGRRRGQTRSALIYDAFVTFP
jgi:hypothetical protein